MAVGDGSFAIVDLDFFKIADFLLFLLLFFWCCFFNILSLIIQTVKLVFCYLKMVFSTISRLFEPNNQKSKTRQCRQY